MDIVVLIIALIIIPVYFLCNWGLKKLKLGNKNNRHYVAIIPTLIISSIIYIGAIMIWIFSVSYYPELDFDESKWHTNIEERFKMSNDLIESKILIGKTRNEVVQLLGKDCFIYNESHISYYLGFVPGLFNIDPDVLDIYFENGVVIKVGQHET